MNLGFAKEYSRLNVDQKRAVDIIDGPLMVIAGPGSGKTQLLSMRIANILRLTDASSSNILCLTFTESAAENMRLRLLKLIGSIANKIPIHTFHSFGANIIQQYPEYFFDAPLVSHIDELGEFQIVEQLLEKLPHNNPLSLKVNGSYLHLSSLIRTVSWFKRAGLTPEEIVKSTLQDKAYFTLSDKFLSKAFKTPPTSKNISDYEELLNSLTKLNGSTPSTFSEAATNELTQAINGIDPKSRYAKSITTWRNKWLAQQKAGKWVFADEPKNKFLTWVANFFDDYQKVLKERGLYTFDDMILRAYEAINSNEDLKLSLQEQYQYILVDEYQDTNGAQDKILDLMADNPVNEGRPNLMVVGDDDQAIYRFQGADSSVMRHFIDHWQPELIVLSNSYRSGQDLLDLARNIIVNADDRLESAFPNLSKELDSKASDVTVINELRSATESESYLNVAAQIKDLIDQGNSASSIVVLASKHRYLETLVPFLIAAGVPVNYERREQILKQPRILEILNLIELVSAAARTKMHSLEALLPKVLAAEYWELSNEDWWKISLSAQKNKNGWLGVIAKHKNPKLKNFAAAIKVLAKSANHQPVSLTLNYLTGAKQIELEEDVFWEFPWRNHYFNDERLKADPADYLHFMGQFNSLMEAFNSWQLNNNVDNSITDFMNFINLYRQSKLSMIDNSPYISTHESVALMTVYKAKGLEWDSVFVLNVHEDVWGARTRNQNQTFGLPSNLKWIVPLVSNSNDLIRLFYVGLTRARKQLYIVSFDAKADGKTALRLNWLETVLPASDLAPRHESDSVVTSYNALWQGMNAEPANDLTVLLKPSLESYKLSSTHLNDFLAVERGGPKAFLYKHLLKVPEELNSNALYGDSIHKSLEYAHKYLTSNHKTPKNEEVMEFFSDKLSSQPLTRSEFKFFKKRGEDNLTSWLNLNRARFQMTDMSEFDFSSENIIIDGARLTGKIDVIRTEEGYISLIDYKTSRPIDAWTGLGTQAALRAHKYQRQLLFYKLLVDNSNRFAKNSQTHKGVIDFISPDENDNFVSLEYEFGSEAVNETLQLIKVIWQKIIDLDLPDTDKYSPNLSGIRKFEQDLLDGQI